MTRNLEPASRRACGFFNCDEFSRHIPVHLCAPFRTALFQPDVEGLSPYSLLAIHTPDLIRLSGMPNLCGHVGDQVADFFFKILLGDSFVLAVAQTLFRSSRGSQSSPSGVPASGVIAFSPTHSSKNSAARLLMFESHAENCSEDECRPRGRNSDLRTLVPPHFRAAQGSRF